MSKVEKDSFRYTGIDECAVDDGIGISMEDYVDSIEEIKEIRNADRKDDLTKLELKQYQKMTGKMAWLANSTHSDFSYLALKMSKKNNSKKIKDLRDLSKILKKVKERPSKMKFSRIGPKEDLMIVGIGDASFKADDKAVGEVCYS